jgi:hypothetical protein
VGYKRASTEGYPTMRWLNLLVVLTGCGGLDSFNEVPAGDAGLELGALYIDQASLDFGYVPVGTSDSKTLILANEGAEPFTMVSLDLLGADAFSLDAVAGTPLTLGSGENMAVTVRFAPEESDDFLGAVALATDLAEAPYVEIHLDGTSFAEQGAGAISTSTSAVDFGVVGTNSSGTAQWTLENTSDSDVALSSLSFSDAVFGWQQNLPMPYVLRAGTAKSVILTYTPTTETQHTGTATLIVDDPAQPQLTVSLAGRGEYQCTVCAPLITTDTNHALTDFFVLVGLGNDERPVSLQNTGDQPLVIQNITVNNDMFFPEGNFSVSGFSGPLTLAPGQSSSFSISYGASSSGIELDLSVMDQNTLHILSNSAQESDYMVVLGGVAL